MELLFSQKIDEQIKEKSLLVKDVNPPKGGISIIVQNNAIKSVKDGEGWIHSQRKHSYVTFFDNLLSRHEIIDCNININLADHPRSGFFNFCRLKSDAMHYFSPNFKKPRATLRNLLLLLKGSSGQFLLPNSRFTADDVKISPEVFKNDTFDDTTAYLQSKHHFYPFDQKFPRIYTSCVPHYSKLDYFKFALENCFCDGYAYIGSVHGVKDASSELVENLRRRGMAGNHFVPFLEHIKYKYVLYNDGNTLSDRLRLLLNLNSVILKKRSPYEEFYSYLLQNQVNYIEYSTEEELRRIFDFLEKSDEGFELSKRIIENNKKFISNVLNYDNIMLYTSVLLNGLFS
ncbi:MAG: hypothetical protein OHK0037_21400 [Elainellaceae cyanobacterium]